jgi:hypothetical protein
MGFLYLYLLVTSYLPVRLLASNTPEPPDEMLRNLIFRSLAKVCFSYNPGGGGDIARNRKFYRDFYYFYVLHFMANRLFPRVLLFSRYSGSATKCMFACTALLVSVFNTGYFLARQNQMTCYGQVATDF